MNDDVDCVPRKFMVGHRSVKAVKYNLQDSYKCNVDGLLPLFVSETIELARDCADVADVEQVAHHRHAQRAKGCCRSLALSRQRRQLPSGWTSEARLVIK